MAPRFTFLLILIFGGSAPFAALAGPPQESPAQQDLLAARQAEQAGKLMEAEQYYLAAVAAGRQSNDPRLATALNNLAQLYQHTGRSDQALATMKQAVAATETAYGPGDYRLGMALDNLAMLYEMRGHAFEYQRHRTEAGQTPQDSNPYYQEAAKDYQRALAVLAGVPSPRDRFKYVIINNFSQFYVYQKRYADAEALLKPAVEELENSPAPLAMPGSNLKHLLATVYQREGKPDEAEALESQLPAALPPNANPRADPVMAALQSAAYAVRAGRMDDAETEYRQAIAAAEQTKTDKIRGPYYPGVLPGALNGLAELYVKEGRNAEAEDLFKQAISLNEQYAGSSHVGMMRARSLRNPFELQALYRQEGRLNEMEPIYQSALAVEEKFLGPTDAAVADTLLNFARLYRAEGFNPQALPLYQRVLDIQEQNEGDTPRVAATLEDYAALLREVNEPDQADAALARARQIRARLKH